MKQKSEKKLSGKQKQRDLNQMCIF